MGLRASPPWTSGTAADGVDVRRGKFGERTIFENQARQRVHRLQLFQHALASRMDVGADLFLVVQSSGTLLFPTQLRTHTISTHIARQDLTYARQLELVEKNVRHLRGTSQQKLHPRHTMSFADHFLNGAVYRRAIVERYRLVERHSCKHE